MSSSRISSRLLPPIRTSLLRQTPRPTRLSTYTPITTTTALPKHAFSTTSKMAVSSETFLDAAKSRRTVYTLNKDLGSVTTSRIQEIVKHATLHTPSSFNVQSNRVLVLFGAEHDKFWDIVTATLKKIVPEDGWEATAGRMKGFKGAAGSVLFFEDTDDTKVMQEQFAIYADKFPHFAAQSNAMQQFVTWTALELEGLGANLQHYNPLVDEQVRKEWNLPASWNLDAQLVFGGKTAEAGDKTFKSIEDRVKVAGL